MSNRIKGTIRRYAAMALSLTVVICFCFIGTPRNIFTTAADSSKELSDAVDPDMIYPGLDDLIRYPHDPGYVKSGFGGFRVSEAENGGIRFSVSGGRPGYRDGYNKAVSLDGLFLQLGNLKYTAENEYHGRILICFGSIGSDGYAPTNVEKKNLGVYIEPQAGVISVMAAIDGKNPPNTNSVKTNIITSNLLKYSNLKEKNFSLRFSKNNDGSYYVEVNVAGETVVGNIPISLIKAASDFDETACHPTITYGHFWQDSTVDLIGISTGYSGVKQSDAEAAVAAISAAADKNAATAYALKLYLRLRADERASLSNKAELENAYKNYYTPSVPKTPAEKTADAIEAIGDVSLANGTPIRAARALYDALNEEDKTAVTNYEKLEKAEKEYFDLSSSADSELNYMSKSNGLLSSNTNAGVAATLKTWSAFMTLSDIETGGLRYSFTGGFKDVREGYKKILKLNGLLLQFDNLYSESGNASLAIYIGNSVSNYGIDKSVRPLIISLDTVGGRLMLQPADKPLITDDALKYINLKQKRFALRFEIRKDGGYNIFVDVNNSVLSGVIDSDMIKSAVGLASPDRSTVMLTTWAEQSAGNTYSVDFIGLNNYDPGSLTTVAEVEEAINGIADVTLNDASAMQNARRLYDSLKEKDKARVSNYRDLLEAEKKYGELTAEADRELTKLNLERTRLFPSTVPAIKATVKSWESMVTLKNSDGGGVNFAFTGALQNVRDGYGEQLNIEGLTLQFDNYYSPDADNGKMALFIGNNGIWGSQYLTWDIKNSGVAVVFDPSVGEIKAYPGNYTVIKNDELKYESIHGRRFSYKFDSADNGSYKLTFTVNGKNYDGIIPEDAFVSAGNLTDRVHCDVSLSVWNDNQTFSVNFVGVYSAAAQVVKMIDAIGRVKTNSIAAIEEATAAYDRLSDREKDYVVNFKVLSAAGKKVYDLDSDDLSSEAEELIGEIGNVDLNSGKKIRAAEIAFDALTDSEKKNVKNAKTLFNAQKKYYGMIANHLDMEQYAHGVYNTVYYSNSSNEAWRSMVNFEQTENSGLKITFTDAIRDVRNGSAEFYNMDGLVMRLGNITAESGKSGARVAVQIGSKAHDYQGIGNCLALVLDTEDGSLTAFPRGTVILKSDLLKQSNISGKAITLKCELIDEFMYEITAFVGEKHIRGILPPSSYLSAVTAVDMESVKVMVGPWVEGDGEYIDRSQHSFSVEFLSIQSTGNFVFEELYSVMNEIDKLPTSVKSDPNAVKNALANYMKLPRSLRTYIENFSKLENSVNVLYELEADDYTEWCGAGYPSTGEKFGVIFIVCCILFAVSGTAVAVIACKKGGRCRE